MIKLNFWLNKYFNGIALLELANVLKQPTKQPKEVATISFTTIT